MPESNPLEAAIKRLQQERIEIDNLIAGLQKRLGMVVTSPTSPNGPASLSGGSNVEFYRGEFFNLSITKAAEKVLRRSGIPLKTPQIMDAFESAGYEVKGKTPRASIYTGLARSRTFVKVLPDTWDLSERHPEAAAQKEQELQQTKAGKSGRRRRKIRSESRATETATAEGLRTVA